MNRVPAAPVVMEPAAGGRRWWRWESSDRHRDWTRLAVAGVAAAAAMAWWGLPPLDLHGPLHYLGVMDPLCGGTRAARYAAQGRWGEAWRYNPLGIVAVLGAAAVVLRGGIGWLAVRWWTPNLRFSTVRRRLLLVALAAGVVALEVRQQLIVSLLMTR